MLSSAPEQQTQPVQKPKQDGAHPEALGTRSTGIQLNRLRLQWEKEKSSQVEHRSACYQTGGFTPSVTETQLSLQLTLRQDTSWLSQLDRIGGVFFGDAF